MRISLEISEENKNCVLVFGSGRKFVYGYMFGHKRMVSDSAVLVGTSCWSPLGIIQPFFHN